MKEILKQFIIKINFTVAFPELHVPYNKNFLIYLLEDNSFAIHIENYSNPIFTIQELKQLKTIHIDKKDYYYPIDWYTYNLPTEKYVSILFTEKQWNELIDTLVNYRNDYELKKITDTFK
jgi:hypothetical protein